MTADMTGIVKKFYHIVAFSWYAFVIQSIYAKGDSELPPGIFVYGGPWKYLTFLNLVSLVLYINILSLLDSTGVLVNLVNVYFSGLTDGVFWNGICE